MIKINQNDEKIIKELLLPKTVDEISEKTGLDKEQVEKTIKKLDENGLIKKIDNKYVLIDLVIDMVNENYKFDISFIIEIQGNNELAMEQAIKFLEERLNNDERFVIISKEKMDIIKEGNIYFAGFEVRLGFYTIDDVIYFILNYSPTTVLDIYKPNKLELSKEDMINLFSDIMVGINQYISIITNLNKENFALKKYIEQMRK